MDGLPVAEGVDEHGRTATRLIFDVHQWGRLEQRPEGMSLKLGSVSSIMPSKHSSIRASRCDLLFNFRGLPETLQLRPFGISQTFHDGTTDVSPCAQQVAGCRGLSDC